MFTSLNYPSWMNVPAPWLVRGGSNILENMLSEINVYTISGVTIFINFSKENIQNSSFNIKRKYIFSSKKKYVSIGLCSIKDEYTKLKTVWNRNNELFDEIILIDKDNVSDIFFDISNVIKRKYNINVSKFDCIIMNPPYERNLHLKIVTEAITHLKDNNSKCVNLSPVSQLIKLQNLYDEKMFRKNTSGIFEVYKNLSTVDIVEHKIDIFGTAAMQPKLAIQVYTNVCNRDIDHSKFINSPLPVPLLRTIMKKCMDNSIAKYISKQRNSEFDLPISEIHGHIGLDDFLNIFSITYSTQLSSKGKFYIKFNNEANRKAYYEFMMGKCGRFLTSLWKCDTHVTFKYIPYIWPKNEEEMFDYFELDGGERGVCRKVIRDIKL